MCEDRESAGSLNGAAGRRMQPAAISPNLLSAASRTAARSSDAMPFNFLNLSYGNPRVTVSDDRMTVTRLKYEGKRSGPKGSWIAYVNQPLNPGTKLLLETVTSTDNKHPPIFSYEIGFTTCDQESIMKFRNHRTSVCHADGRKCGGESVTHQIQRASSPGSFVCMQRMPDAEFEVRLAKESSRVKCQDRVLDMPATPFIRLTGEVDSVRIVSEPDLLCLQTAAHFLFSFNVPATGSAQFQKTCSISKSDALGNRMIFLNSHLGFGAKLFLIAEAGNGDPVSFTMGFTTCDKSSATADIHTFSFHDPDTCSGHSVIISISSAEAEQVVCVERVENQFVKVTAGASSRFIDDENGVFTCRKAFPFIILNGGADKLTINTDKQVTQIRKAENHLSANETKERTSNHVSGINSPAEHPQLVRAAFKLHRNPQPENRQDRTKPNHPPAGRKKRSPPTVSSVVTSGVKPVTHPRQSYDFVAGIASASWPRLPVYDWYDSPSIWD